MALGRPAWLEARAMLQRLLSASEGVLRDDQQLQQDAILPQARLLHAQWTSETLRRHAAGHSAV
jgi:hypothetical protein